jgi:SSS family solute:Na+ symporter
MDLLSIILIIVYLMVTGYLGYIGYRQTRTAADYLVAGRSANPVVMALSYGATFISTSAIVGFGGVAAFFGMGLLWLTFLNIFVGIFIAFVCFGGPTRRMGHHLDAHTFPELIGKRYRSRFLQVFSGLLIFVFMPLYAMAVLLGAAEFIRPVFRIDIELALYIFALVVAAYVIAGGLKGVMLTDALQGLTMLVGMVILISVTYVKLGGVTAAHQALTDMADKSPLTAIGFTGWTSMPKFGFAAPGATGPEAVQYNLWWTMVSTIVMGVGIGVLAQPQLIVRFMTVKSKQSLNRAVAMGGIFIFFMTGVAFVVGPLSNVYFAKREAIGCRIVNADVLAAPDAKGVLGLVPDDATEETKAAAKHFVAYRLPGEKEVNPIRYVIKTPAMEILPGPSEEAPDLIKPGLIALTRSIEPGGSAKGNTDNVIPKYVTSAMPRWFEVVFLLTLLAAAMSTLSSQFHTMGTSIGRDVFEQVTHKHSHHSILITRMGIALGLVLAIVLGKALRGNFIAAATAIFFGLCGAAFLPVFIGGLFWKRMTRAGAIASVVTGAVVSIFWLVFVNNPKNIDVCMWIFNKPNLVPAGWSPTWPMVDALFIALPLSAIVAVVVSLMTKPMEPAHVDYCFGGAKPKALEE